jgi:hypothetical protein
VTDALESLDEETDADLISFSCDGCNELPLQRFNAFEGRKRDVAERVIFYCWLAGGQFDRNEMQVVEVLSIKPSKYQHTVP